MVLEIIFIAIVLFIGSFLQGASGFGFGLFSMAFLPFMFTLKDGTLLVISLALVTAVTIFIKVHKQIELRKLIYLLSAAIVGRIGAYFILHNFGEMDVLKKVLGFVLIGMVIYIMLRPDPEDVIRKEKVIVPILLGFLGGFIGGVFVVGGPFFVFYFLMASKNKYSYTANLQATFAITSIVTIVMHGVSGDFSLQFPLYFLIGVMSVLIGTRLGMAWFDRLSRDKIQKFASILVGLAGLNLILFS